MRVMNTYDDIFNSWESVADFARDLQVPYSTAVKWKERKSIPSGHWFDLIQVASSKGVPVTYADLAKLAANSPR